MGKRNAEPDKVKEPEIGGTVSLRQFAALVGVDYVSAREALENGRIQFLPGTRDLDYHESLKSWQDTRDHKLIIPENDDANTIARMTPLGRAKLRKESASANLKEMDLAILQGKYLLAEDVRDAVFKYSRTVRDLVLTVPDRVAPKVTAKIRKYLMTVLMKELDEDLGNKVLKRINDVELERVIREEWKAEERNILEKTDKPPKTSKMHVSSA